MAVDEIQIQAPPDNRTTIDASLIQPDKAPGLMEAWKQTIEQLGPVDYPDEQRAAEEDAALETKGEEPEVAEKPKAKAKAAEPEPEPEAETDEDEEPKAPGDKSRALKDYVQERRNIRMREARREATRNQEHQTLMARVQQDAAKYEPIIRAFQALEAGDPESFAKGVGEALGNDELKDWNSLNDVMIKALREPSYKAHRQTQARLAAQEKQLREYQEQQRQAQESQSRAYQEQQWKRGIFAELSDDEDPAVAALIEARPQIADAVFDVQKHHYHQTGGEELSAKEAFDQILGNIASEHQFWSTFTETRADSRIAKKLKGSRAASKQPENGTRPAAKGENGKPETATAGKRGGEPQAGKPPKNVSHTRAAAASPTSPMPKDALFRKYAREMEQNWDDK